MTNEIVDELHKIANRLMFADEMPGGVAFDLRRIAVKLKEQHESAMDCAQSLTLLDIMGRYEDEYNDLCLREIRDSEETAKMILSNEIMETVSHLMRQIRDYRKI